MKANKVPFFLDAVFPNCFIYDFLLYPARYSPLLSTRAASAYKGSPIQGLLLHIKSLLHTRASSTHKGSPAYEGFGSSLIDAVCFSSTHLTGLSWSPYQVTESQVRLPCVQALVSYPWDHLSALGSSSEAWCLELDAQVRVLA